MRSADKDEFYVGYLPQAPSGLAALMWKTVGGILFLAVLTALLLLIGQSPFQTATFEFGVEREFSGIIREQPYPLLLVQRPGEASGNLPGWSAWLLCSFGKFGAAEQTAGLDGKKVRLRGSLIYRDNQTMIEIADGSLTVLDEAPHPLPAFGAAGDPGMQELQGEIVDSKCFLGVMNPGELKLHKACATLCIRGGIPPVFLVRNREGIATYFLLVGSDGRSVNRAVLPLVAEPLRIRGRVSRLGDLQILSADPSTFERL